MGERKGQRRKGATLKFAQYRVISTDSASQYFVQKETIWRAYYTRAAAVRLNRTVTAVAPDTNQVKFRRKLGIALPPYPREYITQSSRAQNVYYQARQQHSQHHQPCVPQPHAMHVTCLSPPTSPRPPEEPPFLRCDQPRPPPTRPPPRLSFSSSSRLKP